MVLVASYIKKHVKLERNWPKILKMFIVLTNCLAQKLDTKIVK